MSAYDRHTRSFWSLSLFPSVRGQGSAYVQAWMISVLLHGSAVGASLAVLGDLKLAPEPEPFKWEVSLVETSRPEAAQPAMAEPTPQPPEPKPVPQKPPAPEMPVEPKIVEPAPQPEPVQTVEPPPQVVQEPPPKIEQKEEEQPVETIHEAATAIPRAAEAVEPPQPKAPPVAPVAKDEPTVETGELARIDTAPPVQTTPTPAPRVEPPVAKEPAPAPPQPIQEATLRPQPAAPASGKKSDYGWLAKTLWDRVALLKRYPRAARMQHLEGKVMLRAVIREGGHLGKVEIMQSSGHAILDEDALEIIRQACPLDLIHPLGRSEVVVHVPISYTLHQ